jgi:hypothetical protein
MLFLNLYLIFSNTLLPPSSTVNLKFFLNLLFFPVRGLSLEADLKPRPSMHTHNTVETKRRPQAAQFSI